TEERYYYSPLDAPTKLWKQFPKAYLTVGTQDPLLDDTLYCKKLLERIKGDEQNAEDIVELKIYPGAGHAYLAFYDMCKEGKSSVQLCGKWLQKILGDEQSKKTN